MAEYEKKYCPRCNSMFECKATNISQCQCLSLKLSREAQEWITAKYNDCLCMACLTELNMPQQLFIEKFLKPAQ